MSTDGKAQPGVVRITQKEGESWWAWRSRVKAARKEVNQANESGRSGLSAFQTLTGALQGLFGRAISSQQAGRHGQQRQRARVLGLKRDPHRNGQDARQITQSVAARILAGRAGAPYNTLAYKEMATAALRGGR